eukprot:539530-Prymnesium_polylepis.1
MPSQTRVSVESRAHLQRRRASHTRGGERCEATARDRPSPLGVWLLLAPLCLELGHPGAHELRAARALPLAAAGDGDRAH